MKRLTLYKVHRERTSLDYVNYVSSMEKLADLMVSDTRKKTLAEAVMAVCGEKALDGYTYERNTYTYDFVKHIGDETYGEKEIYSFID